MHPAFQSSRHSRRSGYGADSTTVSTGSGTVKRGVNISDAKFEDLISGVASVANTAISTVGDVAQARITQKAAGTRSATGSSVTSGAPKFVSKDSTTEGSSGVSGLLIAGAVVVVGGGLAYMLLRKK